MTSTHGRVVQANQVALDQVDFYGSDGASRVSGLLPESVVSQLFCNNVALAWPVVSGVGVSDQQVVSGWVYFNEIPGLPGFYSLRFRPNLLGYWRHLLGWPEGNQSFGQDFDVVQAAPGASGLSVSFTKPQGSGNCC